MQTHNEHKKNDASYDDDNENEMDYDDFKSSLMSAVLFLLLSITAGVWIMQKSINNYYLQTYHTPSPLSKINHSWWQMGEKIGDGLYRYHDNAVNYIEQFNQNIINNFNDNYAYTSVYKAQLLENEIKEKIRLQKEKELLDQKILADQKQSELTQSLTINKTQKVFFAGDSLMQGIAPHMQKYLQGLGIDSINLSKQSTGLSYPKFFDWNNTIKKTLESDENIKVLIIMLGANDPWDMPAKNGKYLKFESDEWIAEYQMRMRDIIEFSKNRHVGIIWITPPNMKKDKLNHQMIHLNDVMVSELNKHNIQIIDSRPIMGGSNNHYNDYLEKDGKKIKVRSADGIHFSPEGQRILAKEVQSYLIIN